MKATAPSYSSKDSVRMVRSDSQHDVDEQGDGAGLLVPDPRRGGGSKGKVRWCCVTFAYQNV